MDGMEIAAAVRIGGGNDPRCNAVVDFILEKHTLCVCAWIVPCLHMPASAALHLSGMYGAGHSGMR